MIAQLAHLTVLMTLAAAPDDAMSAPRLEKMLADGDKDMIVQIFKRYDDDVLAFVDHYLEGGLKLIEDGKGEAAGLASFRTGIAFAKLADEALPGATFTEYAASFASWSPKERKLFRDGQAEFKAGRKAEGDPAAALDHYRASLNIAQSLRDHWGTAMALGAITKMELARGNHAKVEEASRQAQQICAQLRLRLDQVDVIMAMGDVQAAEAARGYGAPAYQYAFSLLRPDDDPKLRRAVLEKHCKALERAGSPESAAALRKQYADLLGPAAPPAANSQ